mgnify:CR=1 FL=1
MSDSTQPSAPSRSGRRRLPNGQRRQQICIYLRADTLVRLDAAAGGDRGRSAYMERLLEAHLQIIDGR